MKEESATGHVAMAGAAGRICLLGLAVHILLSACAVAQSPQASTNQQTPLIDRQKEIALALSACPPAVATKAAVYVLEKSGYVKVRESQNGFTAMVFPPHPCTRVCEGLRRFQLSRLPCKSRKSVLRKFQGRVVDLAILEV